MDSFVKAMADFFSVAIVAAFAENLLFSHAISISHGYRLTEKIDQTRTLWHGTLSILLLFLSSFPLHLASYFMKDFKYSFIFTPLIYVFLITATYFAVAVLVKNYLPLFYPNIIKHLPFAAFTPAIIGGYMLSQAESYTKLYQTVGFCLGCGIGYTIATILVVEGARRLSISDVPKPFRGLPVLTIYVGLLSLVVYGISAELIR